MSQLVPAESILPQRNEWILKISMEDRRAPDAATVLQRIIAGSQYFYLFLARLNEITDGVKHSAARAQFKQGRQLSDIFDFTMFKSIDISKKGKRVAKDGLYASRKLQETIPLEVFMELLSEMIEAARDAADEARNVKDSFTDVRKGYIETYTNIPGVAAKISEDLIATQKQLERYTRKVDKYNQSVVARLFTRSSKKKAASLGKSETEAAVKDLNVDARYHGDLEGLQIIIDDVTSFAGWWDKDVEQLEKLRDDCARASKKHQLMSIAVARKMESEWDDLVKEYEHFGQAIGQLSQAYRASLVSNSLVSSVPSTPRAFSSTTEISPFSIPQPKITKIYLRMNGGFLRHEYLIVHLTHPEGEEFWMRLERAGDTARRVINNRPSSLSTFLPLDKAQAARTEDLLIQEDTVKTKLRFPPETSLTLYILRQLLMVFIEESLIWENCRYFCSVVLELLAEQYPCEGAQSLCGFKTNHCRKAGDRIRVKFRERIAAEREAERTEGYN